MVFRAFDLWSCLMFPGESASRAGTLEGVRLLDTGGRCHPQSGGWHKATTGVENAGSTVPGQLLLTVHTGQYFSQLLHFCPAGVAVQRALAFILVVLQMAHSLTLCAPSLPPQGPSLTDSAGLLCQEACGSLCPCCTLSLPPRAFRAAIGSP